MISKFWAELSNDYEKLFETEIGYDVIIYAGDDQNVKEIHAHSNILCARSQYFRTAFSNEWAEKRDGKFIFRKSNISPQLFNIILRFIYCGNIELKNLQGSEVLKLLIAVDELNINSLISHIQEFLIEHQTEFLQQNPTRILEIIYQHETFTDLWNFCLEKICEEPKILFSSKNFINLKAPLLELLLKRDDLIMDEIEIWEYLLKWCFAQQNMQNDSTKWNKDDIIRIERELYRFIPLIRFYDIEPTDFFYKVYCYKDILPQDLIHDLLEYHIAVSYTHLDVYKRHRHPHWVATADSFIFNFINGGNISTSKVSYVKKQDRAVLCNNNFGPTMGNIYCNNNNWSNENRGYGEVYPSIEIPKNFEVEDYEVFQVIKK
ncbi:BTB/POZ protein [Rhizophagus irregularis DAOM 181602=DAOM 197198]|uniref:BTB/POZ protein n=1 Tax=Rhizophagus irregularis (strain DAOM 181602 / DAOM 197198 / MUCL 43194) TaxID=747089 RepID=A0A2P4QFC9_RHIID|nr:BTB/POZ protein [Rhizophagus irregularis DAOM 181602=DAOM 197198]POG76343.1 BTB/POZ protein [Rhizophagus irregularis DAOM 181602=DAOM 197198]|eukprot:XP_025183209.1 BTB/POZ protein [Rhizophagus irregularis DAOM 181602=DAOM 197198]